MNFKWKKFANTWYPSIYLCRQVSHSILGFEVVCWDPIIALLRIHWNIVIIGVDRHIVCSCVRKFKTISHCFQALDNPLRNVEMDCYVRLRSLYFYLFDDYRGESIEEHPLTRLHKLGVIVHMNNGNEVDVISVVVIKWVV